MSRSHFLTIINVEPRYRTNVLDSDIEKVYGRKVPKVDNLKKGETFHFYMVTLSQIHIVSTSATALSKTEKNLRATLFPPKSPRQKKCDNSELWE